MGERSWTSYANGCSMRPEARASPLHELWPRTPILTNHTRIAAGSTVVSYWLRLFRCTEDKKHHDALKKTTVRQKAKNPQSTYVPVRRVRKDVFSWSAPGA